jgi:hypothetical protein
MKGKGISAEAGIDAARLFIMGAVANQSLTYPPTVPEFILEAARVDEGLKIRAAPVAKGIPWPKGSEGKTYADKAIAYRKAIGAPSHPILSKEHNPKEWLEWQAYFLFRGLETSFDLMRKGESHTVPAISPFDFDEEFQTHHLALVPEPESVPMRDDIQTRIRMGFKMSVLSASLAVKDGADRVAEANRKGLEYLIALGQEWGVPVPEALWTDPQNRTT